jgi:hypothetical protein
MQGTNESVNVVVGVPIYRAGAYILDKFLANQKEIQKNYPSSELVFATNEPDFIGELEGALSHWALKGKVLCYETIKPDYAKSWMWNVACGREAIRQYTLSKTKAKYLLSLDADMTFDPNIIEILEREIQGNDVVYSGCHTRLGPGIILEGGGCCMLTVAAVKELRFRCLEFKNGFAMQDDTMLELNWIRLHKRIKKGFFLVISHYDNKGQEKTIGPRPVGLYWRITRSVFVRYALIRASMWFKHDIGWWLYSVIRKLLAPVRVIRHSCSRVTSRCGGQGGRGP